MQTAELSTDPRTRSENDGAWPRGLQVFALVAFVVNVGTVLLLAR